MILDLFIELELRCNGLVAHLLGDRDAASHLRLAALLSRPFGFATMLSPWRNIASAIRQRRSDERTLKDVPGKVDNRGEREWAGEAWKQSAMAPGSGTAVGGSCGACSQWRSCVLTDEAAQGRVLARTICTTACHNITAGELDPKHSNSGPNLQNVYMSLAGTTPAPIDPTGVYHHPLPPLAAARDAGVVWTDENLLEYLRGPREFLDRKTGEDYNNSALYMPFSLRAESDRRSAVAYLRAIKNHPECD